MAVILPFEEAIYRNADIPCEFVGHPILDEIREVLEEVRSQESRVSSQKSEVRSSEIASQEIKYKIRQDIGLMPDKPAVALMPGSRHHEVERLMPVMVEVITEMHRLYPDYQFVMPVAPNLDISNIHLLNKGFEGCHVVKGQSIKALLASDIAVIASGTSTLQAAILGIPTVVVYKLSRLTYFLGKLIVKVKHISLVNILLDYISAQSSSANSKENLRIKELLQEDANKDNIIMELCRIIKDTEYRDVMVSQLKNLLPLFASKEASARVAEMAKELAG
jgi:lipid-A-disaccharide synthase